MNTENKVLEKTTLRAYARAFGWLLAGLQHYDDVAIRAGGDSAERENIKISEISPCIVTDKINRSKGFCIKFIFSMTENIVLAFLNGQIFVKKPVSGKF